MTSSEARAEIRHLRRRLAGAFLRGVVEVATTTTKIATAQLSYLGATTDGVEVAEPFGLAAKVRAGAEAVIAQIAGVADHPIVLAWFDRRYRPVDLEVDEVCLYDANGHRVRLRCDRVRIEASDLVELGTNGAVPLGANTGVVQGEGIDPFTGATYFALGSASAIVKARKV